MIDPSYYPRSWQQTWVSALAAGVAIALTRSPVLAQITADTTLGTENSIIRQNVTVRGKPAELIVGGAIRGANLFHSFTTFNVGDRERVYFANPAGITTIFSRVTGNNASNILGTLGVDGQANLFLLNANGILFGPNATLDITGSFVATTASAIQFGDRGVFSTIKPETPALLTVNPSALLFNQMVAAPIRDQSRASAGVDLEGNRLFGLRVPNGQGLFLVGGEVILDKGGLSALEGRVELAGVAGSATVGLTTEGNRLRLNDTTGPRANVSVLDSALIDTSGAGGGIVRIQGNDVTVTGKSVISADTVGDRDGAAISIQAARLLVRNGAQLSASAIEGSRGDTNGLSVNASESVELSGTTQSNSSGDNERPSRLEGDARGSGVSAGVVVNTARLTLQGGARISSSTITSSGSNILINASDRVEVSGTSPERQRPSALSVQTRGIGRAGDMTINTRQLIIQAGGEVSASTFGAGQGGNITVNAPGSVTVSGTVPITGRRAQESVGTVENNQLPSRLVVETGRPLITQNAGLAIGSGRGGTLTINTDRLVIQAGGEVSASTFSAGQGGDIVVNASKFVDIAGTSSNGQLPSRLTAETGRPLELLNGRILRGTGEGGNLSITTPRGQLSVHNRGEVTADSQGTGRAGNLIIQARSVVLNHQARISSDTRGRGRAGSIIIRRADAVFLNARSSISTTVQPGAVVANRERGGRIDIQTRSLTLTNNADITARTRGRGNAGNIRVDGAETVDLNRSRITSEVGRFGVGRGGRINIQTRSLTLTNNADITARTRGRGNAGNITIGATASVSLDNSSISSSVSQIARGRGGNINVQVGTLDLANHAEIAADSEQQGRNAGNIDVLTNGRLRLNDSDIRTSAIASAGGAINLRAATVELRGNGDIRTNVSSGVGGGGNITIKAGSAIAFDDSDILAFAVDGRGGDINLGDTLFFGESYQPAPPGTNPATLDSNGRVDVNASGTVDGTITFPDVSLIQNSLSELPQVLVNPDQLLANSCIARSAQRQGSFTVTGAGGLPTRPETATGSPFPTGIVQPLPDAHRSWFSAPQSQGQSHWQSGDPIVEPQGVYQLPNGRLVMSRECS